MTEEKASQRLARRRLKGDAKNRALRTFLTGLAIDVVVGLALVLGAAFATAEGWGDLQWAILSFSIAKSFVQSFCSYVLRRFLDASSFPTPLPPEDPGPPAEEVEEVEESDGTAISDNRTLVDADAQVRLVQAQVDLSQAQGDRERARQQTIDAVVPPRKRAPRKAPVKKVTPLEEIRAEAKRPTVAKRTPTPRKKQP